MLDCKFTTSDGTGDMKLLVLAEPCALFNFMSSLVAKCLSWAVSPNTTPVAVKLARGTVLHISGSANGLASGGV